jgi:Tol biopolymer transport system component/imidazolonepropionase-like amidohydrolase
MKRLLIVSALFLPILSASCASPRHVVELRLDEGTNMAAALSPDGSTLAIDFQGTLWVLPVGGGEAIAITDEVGDSHEPVWSPDGESIAFHSYRNGNFHIWTVRKDGSELRQVTDGFYDDREPSWSPDGTSIVFSSDRSGSYNIWRVELPTGETRQLTFGGANSIHPAVSPDGRRVAFVSERTPSGIYVLEGGEETLLIPTSSRTVAPSWSPDGNQLAYVSYSGGGAKLHLLDIGEGEAREVQSSDAEDIFPFRASWRTDGALLYTADGKIKTRVIGESVSSIIPFEVRITLDRYSYRRKQYDFDDASERPVMGIIGPVVSPEGSRIAFAALGDIYVQEIGGRLTRLSQDRFVNLDPDWSPDGNSLAYVSDRTGRMQVWVRDVGTGRERLLTDRIADAAHMPAWSPRGDRIAFYTTGESDGWGRTNLVVADVANGEVEEILSSLFQPGKPAWSPDGNTIGFMSSMRRHSTRYREGTNSFALVSLGDRSVTYSAPDSAGNPGMRSFNGPAWSPDGTRMAYTQDGVLWTVPVNEEGVVTGSPRQITDVLAEKISWTGDSRSIVYLSSGELRHVDVETGESTQIPLELRWRHHFPNDEFVIHAGRLFNGIDSTYTENVDIRIRGHRIVEVVPHQSGREGLVIDASDKVVLPGLIESHSHQAASDGEMLGRLWLSYGITSVREPGADPYDALERRESWNSGARPGPRLFYTGGLLDGSRVYYGLSNSILTEAHLQLEMDRAKRMDFDMIKTYVRMSDVMQKRLIEEAHAIGLPVSSHELYPAVKFNVDAVEHLAGTSRHGYSKRRSALNRTYQDVIQLTAASGVYITPAHVNGAGFLKAMHEHPTLAGHRQFRAFYSDAFIRNLADRAGRSTYESFRVNQQAVRAFVDGGGHLTAGTDSPQMPYGATLHAELWLFVDGGLSPFQALRSATMNAAKAIGVDRDLGSVEAGKLADLVIVDGDPLANISDAWNVRMVFKNGVKYEIDELLGVN